jgi:hypothetical protein
MQMIKPTPSTTSAPTDLARTALRSAIAERNAAKARHHHAEQAEQLGRELLSAAERLLVAFGDVDVSIDPAQSRGVQPCCNGQPIAGPKLAR